LIGGMMVQLHAFEHGDGPRPTADIDLLGGAKRSPRMTEAMASLLVERGAEIAEPPRSDPHLGTASNSKGRPSSFSARTAYAVIRRRSAA
jgi:hypothetical protein